MPRRSIAAALVLVFAMSILPCVFIAQAQQTSHACCAPRIQAHSMACCNSAAPHRAILQTANRSSRAFHQDRPANLPGLVSLLTVNRQISLFTQPSKRTPATILRT